MLLNPVLPPPSTGFAQDSGILQLSMDDAIPPIIKLSAPKLTYGDLRLCLIEDYRAGVLGFPLSPEAARKAVDRVELLDLWPRSPCGWQKPFGLFLRDLAPILRGEVS